MNQRHRHCCRLIQYRVRRWRWREKIPQGCQLCSSIFWYPLQHPTHRRYCHTIQHRLYRLQKSGLNRSYRQSCSSILCHRLRHKRLKYSHHRTRCIPSCWRRREKTLRCHLLCNSIFNCPFWPLRRKPRSLTQNRRCRLQLQKKSTGDQSL